MGFFISGSCQKIKMNGIESIHLNLLFLLNMQQNYYLFMIKPMFAKYECPFVFLPDGTKNQQYVSNPWGFGLHPTNVRYEPAVYAVTPQSVVKDSTCIAMTRALGDFYAHQFGLTYLPSITIRKINGLDCQTEDKTQTHMRSEEEKQVFTIILASDGIWDVWKYG